MKSGLGEGKILMVAGGRELIFHGLELEMFNAGVNAIVSGNYLTTKGDEPSNDRLMLNALGLSVAISCDHLK
jgi:biotin synthase